LLIYSVQCYYLHYYYYYWRMDEVEPKVPVPVSSSWRCELRYRRPKPKVVLPGDSWGVVGLADRPETHRKYCNFGSSYGTIKPTRKMYY